MPSLRDMTKKAQKAREKARENDRKHRTLVGAHLPRETAELVRKAAEMQSISRYRFIANAIDAAIEQSGVRTYVRLTKEELKNQTSLFSQNGPQQEK